MCLPLCRQTLGLGGVPYTLSLQLSLVNQYVDPLQFLVISHYLNSCLVPADNSQWMSSYPEENHFCRGYQKRQKRLHLPFFVIMSFFPKYMQNMNFLAKI